MSLDLAETAIALWDITPQTIALVAERENKVYRVDTKSESFALRQHRTGYRTDAQLASELVWMDALGGSGLSLPHPLPARDGSFLKVVENQQFDVLTWLSGRQLGCFGTPLDLPNPIRTFTDLGGEMARLHSASDAWTPPANFTRPSWNTDGLLGSKPLWGRFWENPFLNPEHRALFEAFRVDAQTILATTDLDFGLIHADLLRENILVDGLDIHLIDFDDGGWGFRLFELATTLFRIQDEHNYPELKTALIGGYQSQRAIDLTHLPLFIALRACTYVGWIVTRMSLPNAADRNRIHIKNAIHAVQAWNTSR